LVIPLGLSSTIGLGSWMLASGSTRPSCVTRAVPTAARTGRTQTSGAVHTSLRAASTCSVVHIALPGNSGQAIHFADVSAEKGNSTLLTLDVDGSGSDPVLHMALGSQLTPAAVPALPAWGLALLAGARRARRLASPFALAP